MTFDDLKPGILTDTDLRKAVDGGLLTGCRRDATSDWRSPSSQIQPCSLDLYPRDFFTHDGRASERQTSLSLAAGGAVLIRTREEFSLPANIAGFVFTPTHLSLRGFFSPSIGHIDPGFKGPLTLVGINMGKETLTLHDGMKVATVVLYKLTEPCAADYSARKALVERDPQEIIRGFAADFGNFRATARAEAREVARNQILIPIGLGVLLVAALQLLSAFITGFIVDIDGLRADVARLEGRVSAMTIQERPEPPQPSQTAPEQ